MPDESGRCIVPPMNEAALNTDASGVVYGGTLNDKALKNEAPLMWCDQRVCVVSGR